MALFSLGEMRKNWPASGNAGQLWRFPLPHTTSRTAESADDVRCVPGARTPKIDVMKSRTSIDRT
jgi:hypothetical protein